MKSKLWNQPNGIEQIKGTLEGVVEGGNKVFKMVRSGAFFDAYDIQVRKIEGVKAVGTIKDRHNKPGTDVYIRNTDVWNPALEPYAKLAERYIKASNTSF